MDKRWVQIWGQAHSALSHFYYPSDSKTFRFVINSALNGEKLRIRLSNRFSDSDVYIGEITAAACHKDGSLSGDIRSVCFHSQPSFVLARGDSLYCDEISLDTAVGDYIAVSIYVEKGALKSGNLLNNISLITVKGNSVREKEIINERRKRDTVIEAAGRLLNLFLHKPLPLLESVEVLNSDGASAITVFGDSLCQQGFWVNRFEERIRQTYRGRYSVINKSIMGNRVLRDFSPRFPCRGLFGDAAIKRLDRDVLSYDDTEIVIISVGTNDLLQPGTIAAPGSDNAGAEELLEGMITIASRVRESGRRTVVFNVPMFGECIDSRPHKEEKAKEYNRLLRESKNSFCYFFNQADIVINKNKPNCTDKKFLGRDNLHYNETGGRVIADSIDMTFFE